MRCQGLSCPSVTTPLIGIHIRNIESLKLYICHLIKMEFRITERSTSTRTTLALSHLIVQFIMAYIV